MKNIESQPSEHNGHEALVARLADVLPLGKFGRDAVLIGSGTAAGQALVIAISPLLTRLYAPEDFGLLAVYTSILAILMVVSALRYELAIPLPDADETAANMLALALGIVVVSSGTLGGVVGLQGERLVRGLNASGLSPYLWLLPAGLLAIGFYQVFLHWAVRKKAFADIAKTKISQAVGLSVVQVGMGALAAGPVGLLVGDFVGRSSGLTALARGAWKKSEQALKSISVAGIMEAAARYFRFPLYGGPSALLNSVGQHAPALMLAGFYGPEVAGWYILAHRITAAPLSLIGQSVSKVYFSEASYLVREQPKMLPRLYWKTVRKLFLIGVGPALVAMATGQWVFQFVFGDEWLQAGLYVQIMSVMVLIRLAVSPVGQTLYVLEKQDLQLVWDFLRVVLVIGGLALHSSTGGGSTAAIFVLSISASASYLLHLGMMHWAIRNETFEHAR